MPPSFRARVKPTRSGVSMVAPAPGATTSAGAPRSPAHTPETAPFGPSIAIRSSAIACHDGSDGGHPLPRDVGIRLSGMEARGLLSGGPEGPRDALVLRDAAELRRDQLHVPPIPGGEDLDGPARPDPRRLRLHAVG